MSKTFFSSVGEHGFQSFIGWQLRVGVLLTIVLALVGLAMRLAQPETGQPDLSHFPAEVAQYVSWASLLQGLAAGKAAAVMQLAIAVLIATPLLRIACSLVAFVMARDWLYVAITAVVALIIASTIAMGITH